MRVVLDHTGFSDPRLSPDRMRNHFDNPRADVLYVEYICPKGMLEITRHTKLHFDAWSNIIEFKPDLLRLRYKKVNEELYAFDKVETL